MIMFYSYYRSYGTAKSTHARKSVEGFRTRNGDLDATEKAEGHISPSREAAVHNGHAGYTITNDTPRAS